MIGIGMNLKTITFVLFLFVNESLIAACDSSDQDKLLATSLLHSLPEVENWKAYVLSHEDRKPVIADDVQTVTLKHQCFLKFSLRSDEGTHFHRWHDFYIGQSRKEIYIDNDQGDLLPILEWRQSADGKFWRIKTLPNQAAP